MFSYNKGRFGDHMDAKEAETAELPGYAPLEILVEEDETAPSDFTAVLSESRRRTVRASVARHTRVPKILAALCSDPEWSVRYWVACNKNTPGEALARLADDPDMEVCWGAARNPKTPSESLARLAGSDDQWVRRAVAKNPATAPAILTQLSKSQNADVREGVAANKNTPTETLNRLGADEEMVVRLASERTLARIKNANGGK